MFTRGVTGLQPAAFSIWLPTENRNGRTRTDNAFVFSEALYQLELRCVYRWWESNPQNLHFECNTYTVPSQRQIHYTIPALGFEPRLYRS